MVSVMPRRATRVALAVLVVTFGSLLLSLLVNVTMFRFGPWADVWVEQTWLALAAVGTAAAFFTRRSWLY